MILLLFFATGSNSTSSNGGKICRGVLETSGKFATNIGVPTLANISANFLKDSKSH
jgi:hypothetical protein